MAEEREIMLKELKAKVLAWEKTQNFDKNWPYDSFKMSMCREFLKDFIFSDSMDIKEFWQKEDRNFPYFNSQLGKLNKYSQDEATKIVSDFVKYV